MRSLEETRRLLNEHWPHLGAGQIREFPHIGWGGDFDAFGIDDHLVFLFPRHADAARALTIERCLLPLLAPRVALPIPVFAYIGPPGPDGPLCVGYPLVPGTPLTPRRFRSLAAREENIERMAARLGAFLSGLHTFPTALAQECGLRPPAPLVQMSRREAYIRALVYPILSDDERAYLDRLFAAFLGDLKHTAWMPTVCHGDLTPDHILVDHACADRISGIIDFADVYLGDPADDFVWRFAYGDPFFARVLAHYRAPIGEHAAFARRVAYRYQLMAVNEIAYGLETENPTYVAEGRRQVRAQMRRRWT